MRSAVTVLALLCAWYGGGAQAAVALPADLDLNVAWNVDFMADLTNTGSPQTAFQTVSFGVALLNKTSLSTQERELLLAAWKQAVPRGTFRLEGGADATYPRHGHVAARVQASFLNQSSGEADAAALWKLLLDASGVYDKVFVASGLGTWYPNIEFATNPYVANSAGRGAGVKPGVGRELALHFTLKLQGLDAVFGFDDALQAKLTKAISAAVSSLGTLPGIQVTPQQEYIEISGKLVTNTHVHVQVTRASLADLTRFINTAKSTPQAIFNSSSLGQALPVTVEPWSGKVTLVGNGFVPPETKWGDKARATAARLALYAAAIRCKWPRVANWTCANCKISQTQLLDAFVSDDKYEDAKDAFTIHYDAVLNATVVTFRSTYGNAAGWKNAVDFKPVLRTIAGGSYRMHGGFSSSYYSCSVPDGWNTCVRGPLMTKLRAAIAKTKAPSVIFTGHSRGGAMATMAAVDAALDKPVDLGIKNAWSQVKLYTFGQPRVGDASYAALVEGYIGERFRLVSNADIAPHMPPTTHELNDPASLPNLLAGTAATAALNGESLLLKVAAWVIIQDQLGFGEGFGLGDSAYDFRDDMRERAGPYAGVWRHYGPQILLLDYLTKPGGTLTRTLKTLTCASDGDSTCEKEQLKALDIYTTAAKRFAGRPAVTTYTFGLMASLLNTMQKWPLMMLLDHGWYMGVDVGNEKCVAMKPPGWAGWKLTLGTLDSSNPSDGTDGNVGVRWQCGPANAGPTTPRYLPFNCGIDPLEARDLNLEDLNCFETGDKDMQAWEVHPGVRTDLFTTSYYPSAQCLAPGVRPVVDVSLSSNEDWKLGSVALELSTTSGPDDRISTRWFGRCADAVPLSAAPTLKDGQTKSFTLCEVKPWWSWKLAIRTAARVGAGTDADLRVSWKCGSFEATNSPIRIDDCDDALCFEFGITNRFEFDNIPGEFLTAGNAFGPGNYPVPACTAAGVKPVLTITFKGPGFTDEWDLDASALELQLSFIPPDETFTWGDVTGTQLHHIKSRRFKPCNPPGVVVFPSSKTAYTKSFTLCAA
ncbi:hypothetical protein ABPG77_006587 [Micractinium sp. CCAP 211/92]